MRAFLGLFIATAVSTVSGSYLLSARQANGYPACTNPCLANPNLGNCLGGELSCLCNDATFVSTTTACFQANCNATDLAAAENTAKQVCESAGVTLTSSATTATVASSPAASSATSPAASSPVATTTSSSSTPSASTTANKSNSAGSNAVNIIGGAAALGLTALML